METKLAVQSGSLNGWQPDHRLLFGVAAALLAAARLTRRLLRRARERRDEEQARRLDAYIQDCLARNRGPCADASPLSSARAGTAASPDLPAFLSSPV